MRLQQNEGRFFAFSHQSLFSFQTISSDSSGANCSQTEERVCSNVTARLASDSQLITSCSSVCCTTSKCNGKEPGTTTVSTESEAPSTTASTKGTLGDYLQQRKKTDEEQVVSVDRTHQLPGVGGSPIYGLCRYVPRDRVGFLRFSILRL